MRAVPGHSGIEDDGQRSQSAIVSVCVQSSVILTLTDRLPDSLSDF